MKSYRLRYGQKTNVAIIARKTGFTLSIASKGIVFILIGVISTPAQVHSRLLTPQDKRSSIVPHPAFRYVIVHNLPLHNGRLVNVLIDQKSFSEANLRELFKLLSNRFPKPDELHVGIYTSLEQLPTLEEQDYAKSAPADWEPSYIGQIEKYPGAVYTRAEGNEAFRYSMGNGEPKKTVVMKGKDPFEKDEN